jgi:hypothetical protein
MMSKVLLKIEIYFLNLAQPQKLQKKIKTMSKTKI